MPINLSKTGYIGEYVINDFDVEVNIGEYSSIANRCTFVGGQHPMLVSTFPFKESCNFDYSPCPISRPINIGSDVWIGQGVSIMEGVTIGDGAVIGACSMVVKDIPPYTVACGNPAIVKKYRFPQEIINKLLAIKWWNWPHETVMGRIKDFVDINLFLTKYGG